MNDHPVTLIVEDDLRRSRLTVFFRLLLTLPHVVWLVLWTVPALVAAVLNTIVVLITARTPRPFQRFLSAYIRYSSQVAAFFNLAANPFPGFVGDNRYPLAVEIQPPERQRRLVTLFKLVLVVPALLIALVLGGIGLATAGNGGLVVGWGFGVAGVAAFLAWFAALARGRMPDGLRDAIVYAIGYGAQLSAYSFSLTDRYPTSDPNAHVARGDLPEHPVRLILGDDGRRSRLTVFFRLLLAIPHLIIVVLWGYLMYLVGFLNWICALVTGRLPEPLHRFTSAYVRYLVQVQAYVGLVANPFPGFVATPYPFALEIDPPARQHRLVTLFRLVLALPALFLSGVFSYLLFVAAFLGWFAALVTGRMPVGLRNAGAAAIRYGGQAQAYLFLLTSRYPNSNPLVPERGVHEPEEAGEPEWEPAREPEAPA